MRFASFLLIALLTACVDRIEFELGAGSSPVVVHGFISDEPGPYTVEVSRAIESDDKLNVRKWISVKRMVLSDSEGTSEQLTEVQTGIYQTSPGGIRGKVGNAYSLRVELFDGKIYESVPDTLLPAGEMEDVYFDFNEQTVEGATEYGFDIFFNSSAGSAERLRYIWKLVATYQVTTTPEQHVKKVGEGFAPDPRPCSGYVVGPDGTLEEVGPCECCTCWVKQIDGLPIVSDLLIKEGSYQDVKIGRVALDPWIMQHKVHAEVRQQSLGRTAYTFWKAVVEQKDANSSLFQPITGRLPTNFVQVSGETGRIEGIFYATGTTSKSVFIDRDDVPNSSLLKDPPLPFNESCLLFADHSTNVKPWYWD